MAAVQYPSSQEQISRLEHVVFESRQYTTTGAATEIVVSTTYPGWRTAVDHSFAKGESPDYIPSRGR